MKKLGFKDKNGKEICLGDSVQCAYLEERTSFKGFNEYGEQLCYPARTGGVGTEMFSKQVKTISFGSAVFYNEKDGYHIVDTNGIIEIKHSLQDVVQYCAIVEQVEEITESICYSAKNGKIQATRKIWKNGKEILEMGLGGYDDISEAMKICEEKIKTIKINL